MTLRPPNPRRVLLARFLAADTFERPTIVSRYPWATEYIVIYPGPRGTPGHPSGGVSTLVDALKLVKKWYDDGR